MKAVHILIDVITDWKVVPRTDGISPARAFFSREMRTSLPSLKSEDFDPEEALFKAAEAHEGARKTLGRIPGSRELSGLQEGDCVDPGPHFKNVGHTRRNRPGSSVRKVI